MYWFNGSITITMKDDTQLFIYDIPFNDQTEKVINNKLAAQGYTYSDIKWAQYFPSALDLNLN